MNSFVGNNYEITSRYALQAILLVTTCFCYSFYLNLWGFVRVRPYILHKVDRCQGCYCSPTNTAFSPSMAVS